MAEERKPDELRGEVEILINGQPKIIRFSLRAKRDLVVELGLDSVEKIPDLMKKMDADILAHIIHCALISEHAMSLEEVMDSTVPTFPAISSIIDAINLAETGRRDGGPFVPSSSEGETTESESPGVSLTH